MFQSSLSRKLQNQGLCSEIIWSKSKSKKIKCKTTKLTDSKTGQTIEKPNPNSFLCMLDYFRNILVHLPLKGNLLLIFQKNLNFKIKDRLGGAKADRRKEVAISTAVDNFIATKTTSTSITTDQGIRGFNFLLRTFFDKM